MSRPETAHQTEFIKTAVNPRSEFRGKALPEKPQDKCGTLGVYSKIGAPVAQEIPPMQNLLQHRGTDTAGRAVFLSDSKELVITTGEGLVKDVFGGDTGWLWADRGIGHNRYGTSGEEHKDNSDGAHPVFSEWKGKMVAVGFNGNLREDQREILRNKIPTDLLKDKSVGFDTNDIADAIVSAPGSDWAEKIKNGMQGVRGAYSITVLTGDGRLFGLRGPSGTWPLWVGETKDKIIMSSETRVDKALPGDVSWRQVLPGELIEATPDGIVSRQIYDGYEQICALHAVYGAKSDSLMREGLTYGEFRRDMGRRVARQHPIDADIYVGVPDGGLDIADGYAEELGKAASRFIKKRVDVRSYIAPNVDVAADIVSRKYEELNRADFEGKSTVVIDDTIIKSLTLGGDKSRNVKGVIQMIWDAGATRVDGVVILPKFVKPCRFGYVIIEGQLIAIEQLEDGTKREVSEEEIAERMGATSITYATQETMKEGFDNALEKADAFCFSCMKGPDPLVVPPELSDHHVLEVGTEEEVLVS